MAGKAVIITGAAQGLGAAAAIMIAKLGARGIVVCDRNESGAKGVAAELEALGCTAIAVRCEAERPDEITACVAQAEKSFGTIEGLVNCAGDTSRGDLWNTDASEWDRQFAINLRSHFLFTKAVAALMVAQGIRGSIVNIASVQAYGGLPFCMAYAVAKAGLVALTKNNAAELGQHGIKVNAINVGHCATDNEDRLQRLQAGPNWLAAADAKSDFGRISRPEDIAHGIVYLLSDLSFATGSELQLHPETIHGMLPWRTHAPPVPETGPPTLISTANATVRGGVAKKKRG